MNSDEGADIVDPATDLARRCAAAMWAEDQASRRLGMQVLDVGPGRSRMSMTVRADMVNGHGCCHGGFVATLADSAFAFACNTYDQVVVAAGFDIAFVAPARLGDVLIAEAVERSRFGRSGLYDVTVTCQRDSVSLPGTDAIVIAELRGRSRSLGRPHLPLTDQPLPEDPVTEDPEDRSTP